MKRKTLVMGHRGACGTAPENTMASFERALELGADGFELDVRLSRDGQVLVIHDGELKRTTDGKGVVEKTSSAAIARLDAGAWFDPGFAGQRVPTLAQVLEGFGRRALINIELKPGDGNADELVHATLAEVHKHGKLERLVFSSFRWQALHLLRTLEPKARIGVLFTDGRAEEALEAAVEIGAQNLHAPRNEIDAELFSHARAASLALWVWTVNETAEIRSLLEAGVDAICSDFPERVRAAAVAA